MANIELQLEQDALMITIEETVVTIESNLKLLDFGYTVANNVKARIDLNKETISKECVNSDVLCTALEHYRKAVKDTAYKRDSFVFEQGIGSFENLKNLVVSEEGLADDIWIAIKKLLGGVWNAIETMYKNVRKYLDLENTKVEEDEKKINDFTDVKDFDIESGPLSSLITKYKKLLPIYMGLNNDLTSPKDLRKYADLVFSNKWILSNKELFINGYEEDTPTALSYPDDFKQLGENSDKLFSNIGGILSRSYQSKVNSHFLTSFSTAEASIVTMFVMGKTEEKRIIKLDHVNLSIDRSKISENTNSKPSKLSKKVLQELVDVRKNLINENDAFDKESGAVKKYIDEEFKKLSSSENANASTILTANSKAIGNVLAKTANSLVRHIKMFDELTSDLMGIYEKAASTAE